MFDLLSILSRFNQPRSLEAYMPENEANNYIYKKLWDARDKDFVNRILYSELAPQLDYGDGNYATHKMMWGNYGDQNIVFPSVVNLNGKLIEMSPDDAFSHALQNNEYLSFDNPQEADWFSKNYKRIWK